MIEQLLSLQLISYMKSEMDYVPWASAMGNIAYIRRMLGKIWGLWNFPGELHKDTISLR